MHLVYFRTSPRYVDRRMLIDLVNSQVTKQALTTQIIIKHEALSEKKSFII